MKTFKKISGIVLILVLAGAGYGWYLYNKKPADTRKLSADVEISATDLLAAFSDNEETASEKYTDKVLVVSGTVSTLQTDTTGQVTIFLDTGNPLSTVICSFYADEAASVKNITTGTAVRIKGQCTGMLMDVILNKCSMMP